MAAHFGDLVTDESGWVPYSPYVEGLVIGDGALDAYWHRAGSLVTAKWILRWGSDTRFDYLRSSGIVFWLPITSRYPLYFLGLRDWFSPACAGVVTDDGHLSDPTGGGMAYPISAWNPNGFEVLFHTLTVADNGAVACGPGLSHAVTDTYPITMAENYTLQAQISYEGGSLINQPFNAEEAEATLAAARKGKD